MKKEDEPITRFIWCGATVCVYTQVVKFAGTTIQRHLLPTNLRKAVNEEVAKAGNLPEDSPRRIQQSQRTFNNFPQRLPIRTPAQARSATFASRRPCWTPGPSNSPPFARQPCADTTCQAQRPTRWRRGSAVPSTRTTSSTRSATRPPRNAMRRSFPTSPRCACGY